MYFLRQQYSLWTVTQAFKEHKDEYAAAIYLRPDVRFLDKLDVNALSQIVNGNARTIATPSWHTWHGVNDRFAMGKPADMFTYEERRLGMDEYVKHKVEHSERYLKDY